MYCVVSYCILLYCIILSCIISYCIVLYCIVLYCLGQGWLLEETEPTGIGLPSRHWWTGCIRSLDSGKAASLDFKGEGRGRVRLGGVRLWGWEW